MEWSGNKNGGYGRRALKNFNYFKSLIFCQRCGKTFNIKRYPTYNSYVCSGLKNYGKEFCNSKIIKEETLLNIIQQHCDLYNKDFSMDKLNKLKALILRIEIGKNDDITIKWKDSSTSKVTRYEIKF